MKKLLASAMLVCATQMWGADFNENFCDSTLRVDYIFGGGPGGINLMLDAQSSRPDGPDAAITLMRPPLPATAQSL